MKNKKEESVFSGMPLGLGMALMQNDDAMDYYGSLDDVQKQKIIGYIQGSESGSDAKYRIKNIVTSLKEHKVDII